MKLARRSAPPRKRDGKSFKPPQKKVQTPKKRRLNLRKTIEFKYELDQVLADLDDTITGTLKGSIYAKADKMDQNVAIEFIEQKVEEKIIDQEEARLPLMVSKPLVDEADDTLYFYAKRGSKKQMVAVRIQG